MVAKPFPSQRGFGAPFLSHVPSKPRSANHKRPGHHLRVSLSLGCWDVAEKSVVATSHESTPSLGRAVGAFPWHTPVANGVLNLFPNRRVDRPALRNAFYFDQLAG